MAKKKPKELSPSREFPHISTYPTASSAQSDQYMADAAAFIKSTGFYQDVRGTARCAVAEYMAAMDGLTIRTWDEQRKPQ